MIINLLCFYIGFTMGLSFMDYLDIKNDYFLHLCRYSVFHPFIAILLSPLTFPFYLIILISYKIKGK